MTTENRRLNIAQEFKRAQECLSAGDHLCSGSFFADAINRFYYACFHAAQAALISREVETATHTGTRSQFARHFVQTGLVERQLGRLLAALQKEREDADYQRGREVSAAEADQAREDGHTFYVAVGALLKSEGWLSGSNLYSPER